MVFDGRFDCLVDAGGEWGGSKQKLNKPGGDQNQISSVQCSQENRREKRRKKKKKKK